MRKRRLIPWSMIVIIFATFAVWLEPTRVVWGWLRGEAFYQGRPTSFWADEIARWEAAGGHGDHRGFTWFYKRKTPYLFKLFSEDAPDSDKSWPTLFDGDPKGESVLAELLQNPAEGVRIWAKEGVDRLRGESQLKGPILYLPN